MDDLTKKRMAHNEAVFRSVNEEIETVRGPDEPGETTAFVCECADPECAQTIELTAAQYADVRSGERRFVVLEGHERPEIEDVVGGGDGFAIVEKRAA